MSSLDFTQAKLKHTAWKLRIRDFLDGKPGLTAAQASSHKDCDLGKWLYSEGLKNWGSLPDMKALEKEHETLHRTIKTIIDLKVAGKVKQAEAEFLKIDPLSTKIVDLLTKVQSSTAGQAKKAA